MIKIIFLLFLNVSLLIPCLYSQPVADNFSKLNWLEGKWTRTNAKAGQSGTESWSKVSGNEWQGFGVNMKGEDTLNMEKIKIRAENNSIYYIADVPGNKKPVLFRFTSITDNSFVCENPQHDFPKKIVYEKSANKLKAVISGNGKSIEYLFEKSAN